VPGLASAVTLEAPVPVEALPGFAEGRVAVQDAAAQYAAGLLAPQPGDRVLDACAAPGGKTAHLLAHTPESEVLALDNNHERLARMGDNLTRLGAAATCRLGDAARPADWWDGQPFERILLDAPCSGTGVIRRHPDIKWLRRESDIARLAATQPALLDALWPLLAPGGRLLYATCSALDAENEPVVAGFATATPDVVCRPPALGVGRARPHGHQILPGEGGMDGFFYAWLDKV